MRYRSIRLSLFALILFCSLSQLSCYTLKSASIPSTVNTFFVDKFDLQARNALPTIAQDFAEALRNKILNESRLVQAEIEPDVAFSGSITRYQVSTVAPQAGQTAAFNRLSIFVKVKFENTVDESASWEKPFDFFVDFDRSVDLATIQNELITTINDQLVENIFNAAFAGWN